MKCFGLWVNDDGTAMVAELSPEQGQTLADQVEPQAAENAAQALEMLSGMVGSQGEEENGEEAAMRGYSKGAPPKKPGMGMPLNKVFGE